MIGHEWWNRFLVADCVEVLGSKGGFGWIYAEHVGIATLFEESVNLEAVHVVTHIFWQINLFVLNYLPFLPTLTHIRALRRIAPLFLFWTIGIAMWRFWSPYFIIWRLITKASVARQARIFRFCLWNASSHVVVLGFARWTL